jgi:membrane fusion protein (multidrug efflux system)
MRATVASALILVLAAGCKKPQDSGPANKGAAPPVKVVTTTAAETATPIVLTLTGVVTADQRADVTADTQGKVINVMVERGTKVRLGQPVVQLDVRSAALNANEAQANLAAARAQKDLADQECQRTEELLKKGAITKSEYDRQMTQCLSARDQVAAAAARSSMMAKSVADGLVRAPFDGVVSEKMIAPGEWVQPGKALFTLVKDDPLRVALSVPEAGVDLVKVGQQVKLRKVTNIDGSGAPVYPYSAAVSRMSDEIGNTRSLIVEATIDNPHDGLVAGMFVEAHLQLGSEPHVAVPADAVFHRGKQQAVFVDKNGEAEERLVHLAAEGPAPGMVAILDGVTKGEKVIIKAAPAAGSAAQPTLSDQVSDGAKVVE